MTTPFPSDVYLREQDHTYWNTVTGLQHLSVSALKGNFKKKFDSKVMAPLTAKKELRQAGISEPTKEQIQQQAILVQKKWNTIGKDSADYGTEQHNALEHYGLTAQIKPEHEHLTKMIKAVYSLLGDYHSTYNEVCCYSNIYRLAGTIDKPCFRTASKRSIIDIFDYKTYLKKGMRYKSDYSDFYSGPLSHLEDCNFNEVAIQLSLYAIMLEEHGFKIGRLGTIFIPPTAIDQPVIVPVNYMKHEALAIIKETPKFLHQYEPVRDTQPTVAVDSDDDF